ncbi:UNVERIFIED_CONTAM: hypothetical protein GTU68_037314 [Idotea baltica]|nr:hypothetical protein [Idotea baltica]
MYTEVGECPWNPGHQLVHIGLQGKDIDRSQLPPSNMVFLIDVSGSMNASNKLPLLQQGFNLLVDQLRPEDQISIVTYAGRSGVVLPPTKGSQKHVIKSAINSLRSGGSTAGAQGIITAYDLASQHFIKQGNNRVILATDGDFNVGQSSDEALVKLIEEKRNSGVYLSVLGFGEGNYQDAKMQKLADNGNGNHYYIDHVAEAQKVLVTEFGGTLFTIAKDVKIQIDFNPDYVSAYRLIGYENRMLANQDFADDTKDAGELGAGHTVTALYEIVPNGVQSAYLETATQGNMSFIRKKKRMRVLDIRFRYKKPDEDKSRLITKSLMLSNTSFNDASDNFRWSASVAEFGLVLRNSQYKGKANYGHVLSAAQSSKGEDINRYRSEFIDLVRTITSVASK